MPSPPSSPSHTQMSPACWEADLGSQPVLVLLLGGQISRRPLLPLGHLFKNAEAHPFGARGPCAQTCGLAGGVWSELELVFVPADSCSQFWPPATCFSFRCLRGACGPRPFSTHLAGHSLRQVPGHSSECVQCPLLACPLIISWTAAVQAQPVLWAMARGLVRVSQDLNPHISVLLWPC